MLKRFWITFERSERPTLYNGGCGVTGYDLRDAIRLLERDMVPGFGKLPPIAEVIENIDIRTLDQGHVVPNMHPPVIRGVWYPILGALR